MVTDKQKLFTDLLKQHKGIVFKVCRTYARTPDDRADLAQEITYNIWKAFDRYNSEYKFSTWMYRIALNVAISNYRQTKRNPFYDSITDDLPVFDEDNDAKIAEDKNIELLFEFISQLKPIDKAIILLYLDAMPHSEISIVTGLSISNVATRINRIKEKLKNHFPKQ